MSRRRPGQDAALVKTRTRAGRRPGLVSALGRHRETPRQVIDWLRARVASDLVCLDGHLTGRRYLAGETWSIADIACAACLWWPEHPGREVRLPVHVAAWLERLAALPGWRHPREICAREVPGPDRPVAGPHGRPAVADEGGRAAPI